MGNAIQASRDIWLVFELFDALPIIRLRVIERTNNEFVFQFVKQNDIVLFMWAKACIHLSVGVSRLCGPRAPIIITRLVC